ncbi:QRFP-like peptide receptor [Mytilus galloprovincialis]|uniref:QRFP-like peptide receptor n=1 Tax=Mytilus galloprovincialis TaxID=29158 RepID=UPI003F7BF73B
MNLSVIRNDTNLTNVLLDYEDIDYPGILKVVPLPEIIWKVALFVLIILTAVTGNILIIVVVAWNKRLRTTTNYYIVNLAVSDLLVTIWCSWVYLVDNLTEGFVLGTFFCKFNTFAQVSSLVASILSLTLIACDRFFGVVFAMKAHIIERKARHSIILVWLFSFAIASPLLVFRTLHQRQWKNHLEQWCDDEWPLVFKYISLEYGVPVYHQPARKIYWTTLSVVLFLIPILVMAIAYTRIIKTLWAAKTPGERVPKDITVQTRMKRKIVLTLVLIMIVFAVCWVPIQFTILYAEYRPEKQLQLEQWYTQLSFFAHVLAFANSSINPMIYAGFNDNFKKGFKQMFGLYKKRYTSVSRLDDSSTTVVTSLSKGRIFKEESSFTLNGKTRDAWNGSAQACSKMAIYEELNNLVCSSSDNGM